MQKIEVALKDVKEKITEFYDEKTWHFMTINGVVLEDEVIEIQWMFSKYQSMDEVVIYYVLIKQDEVVPSIVDVIPSAIISQREIVDMFGIEIEGSEKGLYLDQDSLQAPLSSCGLER